MISKRWPAITQLLGRPACGAAADRSRNRCATQASAAQHRSRNMRGHRALGRRHARRRHGHRQRIFDSISKLKLDTIWHNNFIDQIRTLALIPLLGNHGGSRSRLPARQRKNKIWPGDDQYNSINKSIYEIHRVFLGVTFLATRAWLRPVSQGNRHFTYLCDPQWFRDTASRGPTTIVAPESQFRTCPLDHDSIGYPRMSASGESSTTMHRLLHASGSHPIPPPNDPKTQKKAKGHAAQICALLKSNPVITFGEAVPFPTSKVLSIKTVHTYIAMNHTIDAHGQSDEPGMAPVAIVKRKSKSKKTSETTGETPVEVITEVVSKKRPSVESDESVVPKKRRMMKSKASSSKASLDIVNVAQDVVPLQIVESIPAATAEKSPLPKRKSKKRRLVLSKDSDDENVEEQESVKDTVAVAVEESTVAKHTDEVDVIIGQLLEETSKLATDEAEQREQHFDEPEDFIEKETVDKTEDRKEVAVAKTPEKAIGSNQTDEEIMSIDDLLMQIPDNMMLPLPRISTHDKGKEPLEEDETVKGNPAKEMVELICGDVEFLVQLRDQVMKDVVDFFHSFILSKLSDLESLRDLKEKEKLMLNWAEESSLEIAVRRRVYILAKYREMLLRKFLDSHRKYFTPGQPWTAMASQIIDLLSVAHSKSLEDLLAQQKEHGIITDRPSSSQLFKDLADNSGAVLAQFYSLAKSTCWIRPMVLIDGVWTPIQGNDYWRSSCRLSIFVNSKRLPERIMDDNCSAWLFHRTRSVLGSCPVDIHSWGWYRVCTEVIPTACLAAFVRVVEQVQATDNFVCYLSDSDVHSELEITLEIDLVSSDGSTVYRSPSPQFDSFQEVDSSEPNVQLASAISSAFSASLDDLRSFLLQRHDDSQNDIFSRLNTLDRGHRDTMRQHEETLRNLIHNACQDNRTQGDDEQVAAIRSELFDFQANVTENYLNLSTQLGDLVDYIRGCDAKNGEGSSSRPQPPPDDQSGGGGSGGRTTDIV
ncbi:cell division control protein 2C-like [Dorcoceras hygrometricum]|uniref:Cell division control protein 2C-like n=1 Tax=Dorcoceras hygrometricum TaxID=472368 RepID=A0A2Z7BM72_9LAMI|nr:cell division control protein 2C-like [Dorcoceras hygrometricum]